MDLGDTSVTVPLEMDLGVTPVTDPLDHEGSGDTFFQASISDASLEWDALGDGGYDDLCHSESSVDQFAWTTFPNIHQVSPVRESCGRPFSSTWIEHTSQLWKSNYQYTFYQTSFDDDIEEYKSCLSSDDYFSCDSDQIEEEDDEYQRAISETHRIKLEFSNITVNLDMSIAINENKAGNKSKESKSMVLNKNKAIEKYQLSKREESIMKKKCNSLLKDTESTGYANDTESTGYDKDSESTGYDEVDIQFGLFNESLRRLYQNVNKHTKQTISSSSSASSVSSSLCDNHILKTLTDPIENAANVYTNYHLVTLSESDDSDLAVDHPHFIVYGPKSHEHFVENNEFLLEDEYFENPYISVDDSYCIKEKLPKANSNLPVNEPLPSVSQRESQKDIVQTYIYSILDHSNERLADKNEATEIISSTLSNKSENKEKVISDASGISTFQDHNIKTSGKILCESDFDTPYSNYNLKENGDYALFPKQKPQEKSSTEDFLHDDTSCSSLSSSNNEKTTNTSYPSDGDENMYGLDGYKSDDENSFQTNASSTDEEVSTAKDIPEDFGAYYDLPKNIEGMQMWLTKDQSSEVEFYHSDNDNISTDDQKYFSTAIHDYVEGESTLTQIKEAELPKIISINIGTADANTFSKDFRLKHFNMCNDESSETDYVSLEDKQIECEKVLNPVDENYHGDDEESDDLKDVQISGTTPPTDGDGDDNIDSIERSFQRGISSISSCYFQDLESQNMELKANEIEENNREFQQHKTLNDDKSHTSENHTAEYESIDSRRESENDSVHWSPHAVQRFDNAIDSYVDIVITSAKQYIEKQILQPGSRLIIKPICRQNDEIKHEISSFSFSYQKGDLSSPRRSNKDLKVVVGGTKDELKNYSEENSNLQSLTSTDQITCNDDQFQSSTEHLTNIEERRKAHTATVDRNTLTNTDMVSIDEIKIRAPRLMDLNEAVDHTNEYTTIMANISDELIISSDNSSLHEDFIIDTKDDQKNYGEVNVNFETHTYTGQITDSDIQSQTSIEHIQNIEERNKSLTSTEDRKIFTKRNMKSIDEMKARAPCLMTPKHTVNNTNEYSTTMVNLSDEPVMSSDNSSLYENTVKVNYHLVTVSESDDSDISVDDAHFIVYGPKSHNYFVEDGEFLLEDEYFEDPYIAVDDSYSDSVKILEANKNVPVYEPWLSVYQRESQNDVVQTYIYGILDHTNNRLAETNEATETISNTLSNTSENREKDSLNALGISTFKDHTKNKSANLPRDSSFHTTYSNYNFKENADYTFFPNWKTRGKSSKEDFLSEDTPLSSLLSPNKEKTTNTSYPSGEDLNDMYELDGDTLDDVNSFPSNTSSTDEKASTDQEISDNVDAYENLSKKIDKMKIWLTKNSEDELHQSDDGNISTDDERYLYNTIHDCITKIMPSVEDHLYADERQQMTTIEKDKSKLKQIKDAVLTKTNYIKKCTAIGNEFSIELDSDHLIKNKDESKETAYAKLEKEQIESAKIISPVDENYHGDDEESDHFKDGPFSGRTTPTDGYDNFDSLESSSFKSMSSYYSQEVHSQNMGFFKSYELEGNNQECQQQETFKCDHFQTSETHAKENELIDSRQYFEYESVLLSPYAIQTVDTVIDSYNDVIKESAEQNVEKQIFQQQTNAQMTTPINRQNYEIEHDYQSFSSRYLTSKDISSSPRSYMNIKGENEIESGSKDGHKYYREENEVLQPHISTGQITDIDNQSQTSTEQGRGIQEGKKTHTSTIQILMDSISHEPVILSDTSSIHAVYGDEDAKVIPSHTEGVHQQVSDENVTLEPHTFASKITDSDNQSQTSTEQITGIKEREMTHTSTSDREILRKADIAPIDESQIPGSDNQSKTSTEQITGIKEREMTHTSTADREILTKGDMVPIDEKKLIYSGVITSKETVDETAEYNILTDSVSHEPVKLSDTGSIHSDFGDEDAKVIPSDTEGVHQQVSYENVNIEPHTFADKITDSDNQSPTSTEQITDIKEREMKHTSTADRKILKIRDTGPKDENKARDSVLITSKIVVHDFSEYHTILDNISDEPVIRSYTSSLHENYQDVDAKVLLSDTEGVHQKVRDESVYIEPYTASSQILVSDNQFQTSFEQKTDIKEKKMTYTSTADREILKKIDMVPIDEKKPRDSGLIISKQAFNETAEYNILTDSISHDLVILSDTSSIHADYGDEDEKVIPSDTEDVYQQIRDESVNIEPHTSSCQIIDSNNQFQTSTEQITGIKEREMTSTADREILKKIDMVPIDEKKPTDSGLIISKEAVDETAEYNILTDSISHGLVILSDISSTHADYGDEDAKVIPSDTKDVYHQIRDESVNIEPHTSSCQIIDSDNQFQTSSKQITGIKEREVIPTTTADREILKKIDIVPIDEKKARDVVLITSTIVVDDSSEYNAIKDKISNEPVITSDTSSLHENYKDEDAKVILSETEGFHQQVRDESVNIEPHTFSSQNIESDNQSPTSTEQITDIKERDMTHTSNADREILKKLDMVQMDEKKATYSVLLTSKQAVDKTAEYNILTHSISHEPVILSDTSSIHADYGGEEAKVIPRDTEGVTQQVRDESVNIEPHTSYSQITDSDNQFPTSTEQITGIKEREMTHTSTADRDILKKIDMVPIHEKKPTDSGLIISKQAAEETAEYNILTDSISHEPIILSDTSSIHADIGDEEAKVVPSDIEGVHQQVREKSVNIEPHTSSSQITDSDNQYPISTEQITDNKEREMTHTSTADREILKKLDMVSTDEKKPRDSDLIISKQTVNETAEYNILTDSISHGLVILSDISSIHAHYGDEDVKVIPSDTEDIYQQIRDESVNIEPHTSSCQIIDSDNQYQTSTGQITGIKEREMTHTSTADREILKKIDMAPIDEKKARDVVLITSTIVVDDSSEYNGIEDKISDEPVITSDTSSFHENYKDEDAKVILSDTEGVHQQVRDESVNIQPHTFSSQIIESDNQFPISTEQITRLKEREMTHTSTADREILTKGDMAPIDEKKPRDSGLIISKQAVDETAEYNILTDNISHEPIILSDTSSIHADYRSEEAKVIPIDTEGVPQQVRDESVNIEPHTSYRQITDSDNQFQTSTEQITGIKEREMTHTLTADRDILKKIDMVPIDEKKPTDSGLIISKQAVEQTAEYNILTDSISHEPIILSDTSSIHADYGDEEAKVIPSDIEGVHQQVRDKSVIIEPHTSSSQITDSDNQFPISIEQITDIKEREMTHTSTADREILKKLDMVPTDEKKPRDSDLIISKQAVDETTEYNILTDSISHGLVILSDISSIHADYGDEDVEVIPSDTEDVYQQIRDESVTIEPHTSSCQIIDSDNQYQTSTGQITGIKEREMTHTSTADREILKK